MKRISALRLLFFAWIISTVQAQTVYQAPDVPHLVYLGDRVEGVVEQRIVAMDPRKGTWREVVQGVPPISENPPILGQVIGYWDGFTAYREILGFHQKRVLQSGFHQMTKSGRHWFWRAPVDLLDNEYVLSIFNDKALTRRNTWSSTSRLKPGGAPTSAGPSKVTLALVDLIYGDRSEIYTRDVEPYDFQCAVALHMDTAFLFMNTGQIYKLAFNSRTLQSVKEDFWKESGTDLCPGPPFQDHQIYPRFKSLPFFDGDGGILLAFEGFLVELADGNELEKTFESSLSEPRKKELRSKGIYPFKDGTTYDVGARAAILLKFDPELKTMHGEPLERVKHLCDVNAESKKNHLVFITAADLVVGIEGKIQPLHLSNLKRLDGDPH